MKMSTFSLLIFGWLRGINSFQSIRNPKFSIQIINMDSMQTRFLSCKQSRFSKASIEFRHCRKPENVFTLGKQSPNGDDGDGDMTWFDKIFDPIVKRYSELPEEEQSMLASIYQSVYFMICLYVGILLVKAYKFALDHSDRIS